MDNQGEDWRIIMPREYRSIEQIFGCLPLDISELKFECVNGHEFEPEWLKKRPPIRPERLKNGLIAIPIGTHEKCNVCGENVKIELPVLEHLGNCKLYGDEAMRETAGKQIVTYSWVCGARGDPEREHVEKKFLQLKRELCPETDPMTWTLHCTDLLNARKRERSQIFRNASREHVLIFLEKIGLLLQQHKKSMPIWICTGVYVQPNDSNRKELELVKAQIYSWLFIMAVRETTGGGVSPTFYFERTGRDGWAKNLISGVKHTLMWPFITNCIHVPAPKFVEPSTSIYLELADFVSFIVARYLFIVSERHSGRKIDFDVNPNWLGEVRYLGFQADGTGIAAKRTEYPMMEFFSGTGWENHID